MQIKSRGAMGLAVSAMILVGVGAGVALAQAGRSPTASPPSSSDPKATLRSAYLDDVARRAGVDRSKLDAALKAQALDNVTWAEDNGFITKVEADAIRSAFETGDDGPRGPFGFRGPYGPGVGGFPLVGGLIDGSFRRESDDLTAAAGYLGMTTDELANALGTKTLAQVAADKGKPVDGLKQALRASQTSELDRAVSAGDITAAQKAALLARFDAGIDDVVNGIPPSITDLAGRLGVDRTKLIAAIRGAAIDQVDQQVAQGLITKAQADEMKQRIQSIPALPLGGFGPCGGFGNIGHFGPGFGPGFRPGFGPGMRVHDQDSNAGGNVNQEVTVTL